MATVGGDAVFQLVEGGRVFECRIDLASGDASMIVDGLDAYKPTAKTKVQGQGTYTILFSNVDNELRLWVNGQFVKFEGTTVYPPLGNVLPTLADLKPVGISGENASFIVSDLMLYRDIYYIADTQFEPKPALDRKQVITDFKTFFDRKNLDLMQNPGLVLKNPAYWHLFRDENMKKVMLKMDADQFLTLGDNSSKSEDGRLWVKERNSGQVHYVDRNLLIGKAVFIFWPHSWSKIPGTSIPFPFFPNFSEMGLVR